MASELDDKPHPKPHPKPHLVSLSFDDGFRASSIKTAAIFERYGLAANFNVIATGHEPDFVPPDEYQAGVPKGDFGLWRELAARGHEVMPHGYRHANKAELPFAEAKDLVGRCLDVFRGELPGFDAREAVYNLPYNAASEELAAWMPSVLRAYRAGGTGMNPLPDDSVVALSSTVYGPRRGNEAHFAQKLDELLALGAGWLIFLFHGMDGEGYGPVSEEQLCGMIERLLVEPSIAVLPPAAALAWGAGLVRS